MQKQERAELQQSEDRKLGAARALPAPVTAEPGATLLQRLEGSPCSPSLGTEAGLGAAEPEPGAPLTEVVELGPEFLREYLRFNKGGDGRVELEPFIALVESTLLRRGLRVFRKQLEGMFRAADFDDDGVLDLKAFVEMESVSRYFDALQRREIAAQAKISAAQQAAREAAAAAQAAA